MTIEPGKLRVGVWDKYFRFDQHSLTRLRDCPPSFEWVDNEDDPAKVDIVLATQNSHGRLAGCTHPRKVLYLQETTEYHTGNLDTWKFKDFQLVLSNDKRIVEDPALAGRVRYSTLFGTWIVNPEVGEKTKHCSFLASTNNFLSGHKLRHEVAKETRPGGRLAHLPIDVRGTILGGSYCPTEDAYDAYRYNIAIENSKYPWWHTEKLFNCWAKKTIPIYWGSRDYNQLYEWGFDSSALLPWDGDIERLASLISGLQNEHADFYEMNKGGLEQNHRRVHELWCHEITLEQVLREYFGL